MSLGEFIGCRCVCVCVCVCSLRWFGAFLWGEFRLG